MDRLDAIRTLLAAVDGGSLSAASRALGMPLPTVSRKVSELETHVRAQLVIRTSRRLQLTDAGLAFVAATRRVLDDLEDAERAAAGEYRAPRGDLLITAPIMFGKTHVAPVIIDFLNAYPDVNVRLILADHVVDLVENHVDTAVRIGRLPDSGLVATRVGDIHWTVCASPDYIARRGAPVTLAELADHDHIGFEGLQTARAWPFVKDGEPETVFIRPRFSANTADAVVNAAEAGVGIARLLSYQSADAVLSGRLASLLRDHRPPSMPVHLVHTGPSLLPLKLRAFLDFSAPRLKARLARIADV